MTPPAPLTQLPGTVTESLASTAAFAYPVACGSCGPLVPALAADAAPGPHAWAQPQSNVARVRESTLNRPQTARRVVLVVDDDACTTRALRRLLESVGYSVAVADGYEEAMGELAFSERFSAVLCDLTLPDGSGADLVHWLRQAHPGLGDRTIVLTGGAVDDVGRALVADGESEVLTKPFKMATLVERVNAAANRDHDHVRLDVGAFS